MATPAHLLYHKKKRSGAEGLQKLDETYETVYRNLPQSLWSQGFAGNFAETYIYIPFIIIVSNCIR